MARLSGWYGRLLDALVFVACLLLLVMTVMIGADVVSRNIGGGGVAVSNELSEDILYLMTLLAAPWLLRQGQHIRVDIVLRALPVRVAWLLEWVGDIVGFFCCLYFVWYGYLITTGELQRRLDQHQDADHTRMVDACAASARIRPPRYRVYFSHASTIRGRDRLAGRRRFGGLKLGVTGENREHVLADGLAAAPRRLDCACCLSGCRSRSRSSRST